MRTIALCMVGNSRDSLPHMQSVRDAFAEEGIGPDRLIDCLQVNAFWSKREPSTKINRAEFVGKVREYVRSCQFRDSLPNPLYTMWNFEPGDLWNQWRDGFTHEFCRIVEDAASEIRAEFEAQGIESKIGMFGVPISHAERPMIGMEMRWHASTVNMLQPMDWVCAEFYPRNMDPITEGNEANYTKRITHGIETIQMGYGGRECIPFAWLRPGLKGDHYARVYCRAVAQTSVNKLGLWMNPWNAYWASRDIAEIRKAAPYLREWLAGGRG